MTSVHTAPERPSGSRGYPAARCKLRAALDERNQGRRPAAFRDPGATTNERECASIEDLAVRGSRSRDPRLAHADCVRWEHARPRRFQSPSAHPDPAQIRHAQEHLTRVLERALDDADLSIPAAALALGRSGQRRLRIGSVTALVAPVLGLPCP
jgi:hypothetical protein